MVRALTGDERFDYYFVNVKVNVGSRWRIKECRRKTKEIKARELE